MRLLGRIIPRAGASGSQLGGVHMSSLSSYRRKAGKGQRYVGVTNGVKHMLVRSRRGTRDHKMGCFAGCKGFD